MNTGQTRRTVLAGTFTAFLLVAGLGNQWVYDKLIDHVGAGRNSGWQLLARVSYPHWVVDKSGTFERLDSDMVTGMLVGALLLLVAVALVLAVAARRDGFNAVLSGWFATVVGGALYGVTVLAIAGGSQSSAQTRSLATYLENLSAGAGYGLLVGWVVGIGCAVAAGAGGHVPQHSYTAAPPTLPPPSSPPPFNPPQGGGYRY